MQCCKYSNRGRHDGRFRRNCQNTIDKYTVCCQLQAYIFLNRNFGCGIVFNLDATIYYND